MNIISRTTFYSMLNHNLSLWTHHLSMLNHHFPICFPRFFRDFPGIFRWGRGFPWRHLWCHRRAQPARGRWAARRGAAVDKSGYQWSLMAGWWFGTWLDCDFPIILGILGISQPQLTNSIIFSEGFKAPTRWFLMVSNGLGAYQILISISWKIILHNP